MSRKLRPPRIRQRPRSLHHPLPFRRRPQRLHHPLPSRQRPQRLHCQPHQSIPPSHSRVKQLRRGLYPLVRNAWRRPSLPRSKKLSLANARGSRIRPRAPTLHGVDRARLPRVTVCLRAAVLPSRDLRGTWNVWVRETMAIVGNPFCNAEDPTTTAALSAPCHRRVDG